MVNWSNSWQRLRQLKLSDLLLLLVLNSGCALVNAVTSVIHLQSDWHKLGTLWQEYVSVYCAISLFMLLFYLLFAPLQLRDYQWRWFGRLLLFTFAGTFLAVCWLFDWPGRDKVLPGFLYVLSFMAMLSWMFVLVFYLKQRVLLPKLASLNAEINQTRAQRDRANSELQLLQAQLEPHFFFNTLANLHNLIDLDPAKAKLLLEELTAYLRESIPQFRQPLVPLATELRITERYLQIQQIRFQNKFSYQLQICPSVQAAAVLPMSVLTLVENAIKHGFEKQRGQGVLQLCAWQQNQQLFIEVIDSAAQASHHITGTGLANLRQRLQAAFGDSAGFCLTTVSGEHTKAQIRQPVLLEQWHGSYRPG